jgi:hypothetical protein
LATSGRLAGGRILRAVPYERSTLLVMRRVVIALWVVAALWVIRVAVLNDDTDNVDRTVLEQELEDLGD